MDKKIIADSVRQLAHYLEVFVFNLSQAKKIEHQCLTKYNLKIRIVKYADYYSLVPLKRKLPGTMF